ncbi:hypothetical protein [Sulfurospirillum barnesii]|uniref:Uncharacterized protein n=1 Tax=Sulfurospirillum barnesii (strain ATCC 700032 / DSM 10660 / SES-3) TaxID=760154 RepID=I3XXJ6_SULBS|nr:hypothetical protein [Sulfurospirillum barnesii]AFL68670.1 hypothetical protein Sulba_1381 [Sulfurospirillum barnesii SES-3]
MNISYKPLVDRFAIPRPTLIEWQKRAEEKENWRVKHLAYLRMQLDVEKETCLEIKAYAPCNEDLFLLTVYIFFHNIKHYLPKQELMRSFRAFSLETRSGVEYQHDFAGRIWSLRMGEESSKKMVNYYRLFDLLKQLTAAQYALLLSFSIEFVEQIKAKYTIETRSYLESKTWQELFTYDKAFSLKSIEMFFKAKGIF